MRTTIEDKMRADPAFWDAHQARIAELAKAVAEGNAREQQARDTRSPEKACSECGWTFRGSSGCRRCWRCRAQRRKAARQ